MYHSHTSSSLSASSSSMSIFLSISIYIFLLLFIFYHIVMCCYVMWGISDLTVGYIFYAILASFSFSFPPFLFVLLGRHMWWLGDCIYLHIFTSFFLFSSSSLGGTKTLVGTRSCPPRIQGCQYISDRTSHSCFGKWGRNRYWTEEMERESGWR